MTIFYVRRLVTRTGFVLLICVVAPVLVAPPAFAMQCREIVHKTARQVLVSADVPTHIGEFRAPQVREDRVPIQDLAGINTNLLPDFPVAAASPNYPFIVMMLHQAYDAGRADRDLECFGWLQMGMTLLRVAAPKHPEFPLD